MAGIGSVLLLPEVLSGPPRDGAAEEVRILAGLDLRPVDRATAELATALSSCYRLKAVDAAHLATAVGTGRRPVHHQQPARLPGHDYRDTGDLPSRPPRHGKGSRAGPGRAPRLDPVEGA